MSFNIRFEKPQTTCRFRWSSRTNVNVEILKGSVLGPLYFWVHINDLPND